MTDPNSRLDCEDMDMNTDATLLKQRRAWEATAFHFAELAGEKKDQVAIVYKAKFRAQRYGKGKKWWGYLHENGSIQVKPVYQPTIELDLRDAEESPFCKIVFEPFPCKDREEAIAIVKGKVRELDERMYKR